ncbi:MAG: hypothetical protein IH876_06945, partial [Gemmatimonadetes bacterium]|nr:hypothetical protein [Gemmatimonadota bacterium]
MEPSRVGDTTVMESTQWSLRRLEDAVLMATLALILMLPLAEMVARRLFATSISGVHPFTQHFTL